MPARLPLILVACASALALAACKDDTPPPPAAYDFASAPPAPIEENAPAGYEGYALAERAHAFDEATYRAAPSYGFRYGEEEPWAWRTDDDYSMYAEPYDDGYRSYYYAPGADYPYFVRDDDYGYGYGPEGRLIAVYDASGALLPQDRLYALAGLAGGYLMRASALRRYALDDGYRVAVTDDYWSSRSPRYHQARQAWYVAPERQPQWREWRAGHRQEVARNIPRGEVRRWTKADDKAWEAYERADRKAWKEEDKAWRKADRKPDLKADRRLTAARTPPPAMGGDRNEPREDRHADAARPRDVRLATTEPRHASDRPAERDERQVHAPHAPQAAPRDHGDGRGPQDHAKVAKATPGPHHEAAAQPRTEDRKPARQRPEKPRAEALQGRQQPAAAGHGRPERAAAPAPKAQDHARTKGGDRNGDKDHAKDAKGKP